MRFSPEWVHHPDCVFTNLITLKVIMDIPARPISEIGKYLNNLQSLYVTYSHLGMGDSQVQDLMTISSPHLSYIYIGETNISIKRDEATSSTDAKLLFRQYPSLHAVDFSAPQHILTFKLAYHYSRNGETPLPVRLPRERMPLWLRDDFGPYYID
ncbi:hypothetical protein ONZ45_g11525 [Pleurotus djamor]|nr:hypothetical protein ONZ45_g11525 [Pleurotus djamor]